MGTTGATGGTQGGTGGGTSATASGAAGSVGPFTLAVASCAPEPCEGAVARSPVRASRTVIRPGRRNGGTTLIFRLTKPAVLHVTIVRVFPSCKRIGSFNVRAHAGVNRIRFRGRFRGRVLPVGGYRLVVRARGAERAAAAVPIVIARGEVSRVAVDTARNGKVCSGSIEEIGFVSAAGAYADTEGGGGEGGGGRLDRVTDPIVGAAGAVAGAAKDLLDRAPGPLGGENDPFDDPFVLTIMGLFLVAICLLGTLLLAQIVHARNAVRER
jgi:hypothetical protein